MGKFLHRKEQLVGKQRLNRGFALVVPADCVLVVFYFYKQAQLFKLLDDDIASLEHGKPHVFLWDVYHLAVWTHDDWHLQIVALSYLEVVEIVSWSYLDTTSAKLHVNIFICYNFYLTVGNRKDHGFTDKL